MKKIIDDMAFYLHTFEDGSVRTTMDYRDHKEEIAKKGFLEVIDGKNPSRPWEKEVIKIYTPEMAVILCSDSLPVRVNNEQICINGWEYLQSYVNGFKDGNKYFEKKFHKSSLYKRNSNQYIRKLHFNYFHEDHKPGYKGWNFVKSCYPLTLTHVEIKDYGYYAGMVSMVDELLYPHFCKIFNSCEHFI